MHTTLRRARAHVTVTEGGHMLWATPSCAHAYAHARFTLYGKRQRVVPVRHEGQLLWRVTCARPERRQVSEPCS